MKNKEEKNLIKKQRSTELDILRIIAMFGVILLHAAQDEMFAPTDWEWKFFIFCAAGVTWQVPIFVMISGRFFLDPDRNVSFAKLLKKNIPRLVIAFIFWDIIYQIFYIVSGTYSSLNTKGILIEAIQGPYHFWFLFMLVCLYIITPFLRKFTEDKQLMKLFIALFFIFELWSGYGAMIPRIGSTIEELYVKTNFHFALGYSGYFMLGYYLYKYPLSKKFEIPLYFAGIISVIATASLVLLKQDWAYAKYLMPNIILEASALYTFFVKRVSKIHFSESFRKIFSRLADYSFGIYLIHALVLSILKKFEIHSAMYSPVIMLPVIVIISFIISSFMVFVIRKIPGIGKRIM